jgi:hypothetical protein
MTNDIYYELNQLDHKLTNEVELLTLQYKAPQVATWVRLKPTLPPLRMHSPIDRHSH